MSNLIPAAMSQSTLAVLLADIQQHVEAHDSWEGYIEYRMPTEGEDDKGLDYMVSAVYRVGNRDGQGFVRMVGRVPGTPEQEVSDERDPLADPEGRTQGDVRLRDEP